MPATSQHGLIAGHDLIVAERLCGSIPMGTWLISSPSYSIMLFLPSQGSTATSSWANPS